MPNIWLCFRNSHHMTLFQDQFRENFANNILRLVTDRMETNLSEHLLMTASKFLLPKKVMFHHWNAVMKEQAIFFFFNFAFKIHYAFTLVCFSNKGTVFPKWNTLNITDLSRAYTLCVTNSNKQWNISNRFSKFRT